MITKEISVLCKKRKSIYNIKSSDGVNWIGNDEALYPLYKFKELDKSACYALLDIPDGKEDSMAYFDCIRWNPKLLEDEGRNDKLLPDDGMTMVKSGNSYKTFTVDDAIYFVNEKYFKPIKDLRENTQNVIRYFIRKDGCRRYIVVKNGFIPIAIIGTSSILSREYIVSMYEYLKVCEMTLAAEEKEYTDSEVQQTFEEIDR